MRFGSVSYKSSASGLRLRPTLNIILVSIYLEKCWYRRMAHSNAAKGKSAPSSRGRGKRIMGSLVPYQPSSSRGQNRGCKPVSSIINDDAITYHEGTSDEI